MYTTFIRPILFLFDPERIHGIALALLSTVYNVPGAPAILRKWFGYAHPNLSKTLFGLPFKNPVGLAAGFDKNGKWIDEMACFGFGFIEIGTITPKPQAGNSPPRLYRLPHDRSLINRMGFNNAGAQAIAHQMERHGYHRRNRKGPIIGANIGKNKHTPNERAAADYEACFHALYPYVDYFVVNVSSPNTPGLRSLQDKKPLTQLLYHMKGLTQATEKPKPILLKVAPDLTIEQLEDVVHILHETAIDGVIATNTTVSREGIRKNAEEVDKIGPGGMSGAPLTQRATDVIRYLRQHLGDHFPIIGVGGIMSVQDALDKVEAGADLIQLYTGLIYEGPALVKRINHALQKQQLP